MSHLDERALGLYVLDPSLIRPRHAAHVATCEECRLAVDTLREFDAALREPESWIGLAAAAPPATNDELRAFAIRAEEEDAAALLLLAEFKEPTAAARFVWVDIATKAEYQTGGVARLLCKWANAMCSRNPLYALKLAEAATAIAVALARDSYPRSTIHELRGDAYKEQANALRFLGRLPCALRAARSAEAEYVQLPHESIGLAAIQYVRGCILYEQDDLDGTEKAAHEAADAARRLGASDRYINARLLLGHVHLDRHEFAAAIEVFEDIVRYGRTTGDFAWVARGCLAVGICDLEGGRLSEADRQLHDALRLFTQYGFEADVTRAHWSIARLICAQGNPSEAIYRLRRCIREFTAYQMISEAAVVAVDLAEILSATGRVREVSKVLANAVETFIAAGKLTSALTALAYLKDAATSGTMTTHLTAYVRRFIRRADNQPQLLFAPPQESV